MIRASTPQWELRIIAVTWASKGEFLNIKESDTALPAKRESDGVWSVDVPTFPRIGDQHGQLGIRSEAAPELLLFDGTVRPFTRLQGMNWWIEKYKFVKERNSRPYWKSTLNSKAGHAVIRIVDETIRLTLLPEDWSWEAVQQLERDLRNVALSLITENRSSAHFSIEQERRQGRMTAICDHAKRLREASIQALGRPITALASSIRPAPRHKAKPCVAGIIDAACQPGRRLVRSHFVEETANVPENRYLVYLLERAHKLLRLCYASLVAEAEDHRATADRIADELRRTPAHAPLVKVVSREEIEHEEKILSRHLERAKAWKPSDISFYESWTEHRESVRSPRNYLLTLIENDLAKLRRHRRSSADLGWQPHTTDAEQTEEYKRRRSALEKQADGSKKLGDTLRDRAVQLNVLIRAIEQVLARWNRLGVPMSSKAPASLAMRRRPAYVKTVAAYRALVREFGSESAADVLLREPDSAAFGIVDLWLLFERWCFVQLVSAVSRLFVARDSDVNERIVRAAIERRDQRSQVEVFHFDREGLTCSIELEPSLVTEAGRPPRFPDFKLEIRGGLVDVVAILDAKCRRYRESAKGDSELSYMLPSLATEIQKMCFGRGTQEGERNYSMDGKNLVFILHPSVNAVVKPNDHQYWSRQSYYGERSIDHWIARSPIHRYGAVYLRPNALDDLRRLVSLLVHAAVVPQRKGEIEAKMRKLIPCATCGGALVWDTVDHRTQGNNPKNPATCCKCGEYHMFTHCKFCGQRLVKAGWYSTYHALAGQIGNVRCPRCELALS